MGKRPVWYLWVLARIWKLSYIKPSVPVLGKFVASIRSESIKPEKFNISHITINAKVKSVNIPLPVALLENIIRESTHRTIIRRCTCREARSCKEYDINTACLHIGSATEEEDITVARHVTVDQAIEHLHKAVDMGLIPFIGHAAGDNKIWNVSEDRPFVTVCFCCPCCCTIFFGYKYLPQESKALFHRLKGIKIEVSADKCTGCGDCITHCFTDAISLSEGKALHDDKLCKGCGLCGTICKAEAVSIILEDLELSASELFNRLNQEINNKVV